MFWEPKWCIKQEHVSSRWCIKGFQLGPFMKWTSPAPLPAENILNLPNISFLTPKRGLWSFELHFHNRLWAQNAATQNSGWVLQVDKNMFHGKNKNGLPRLFPRTFHPLSPPLLLFPTQDCLQQTCKSFGLEMMGQGIGFRPFQDPPTPQALPPTLSCGPPLTWPPLKHAVIDLFKTL